MVALVTLYANNSDETRVTPAQVRSWQEAAATADGTPHVTIKPKLHSAAWRLGPEVCQEIMRRYEAGETAQALADEYGVAKVTVINLLRENAVTVRHQSPTTEQVALLVHGYASGMTLAELEARYGIPHSTIGRALKAAGVRMRPRGGARRRIG